MAGIPPVTVEVAFDGGPFSTSYTWSDVTPWVEGFSVKRGRSYEVDRMEAGTLDLSLDNSDGRFTPMKNWSTELLPSNVTSGTETTSDTAGFTQGTGVTLSSSTSTPHTGARALRFDGASTVTAWQTIASTAKIPVKANNKYRAAVWLRNTVSAGFPALTMILRVFWYDANQNFIANTMVDSSTIVLAAQDGTYQLFEAIGFAPSNAAYGQLQIQDPTAPGATWVMYADDWSFTEVAPYYPNVIPRRRVRVRTANLLPKDTSTGGDISQTSDNFSTSHVSGQSNSWVTGTKLSGAGAIQVNFVQTGDGVTAFNSSIRCGFMKTDTWGGWGGASGWTWTRTYPVGLAKIVAGTTYTASGYYRKGDTSASESLYARIRWYKDDGSFYSSSSSVTVTPVAGQWVQFSVTAVAGGSSTSGVTYAGVEIGTAGSQAGTFGFIDQLQLEAASAASEWTPGGSIFSGFIEKWPVKINGLTAEVTASGVDGFDLLGTTEFQRPMRQHYLAQAPWGYWPLTEGSGATTVQNLADDLKPATLTASKYGGATAAFGAPSLVANDDGTSFSLTNIATSPAKGTVVDVLQNGQRSFATLTDKFSVAFWCAPTLPSSGNTGSLFRSTDATARRAVEVSIDSTGILTLTIGYPDGGLNSTYSVSTNNPVSTSTPNYVVVSISAGNGTIFLNGSWEADTSTLSGTPSSPQLRQPKYMTLGGNIGGPYIQDFTSGRYAHFAVWDRDVGPEIYEEPYFIGYKYGLYPTFWEDEVSRLSRLVKYAGFLGETDFDATVTGVQNLDWDEGTSALEVLQSTAEAASGYVFMDGDGRLVYHSRKRRQSGPIRYTLGDTTGLPYESDLDFEVDEDRIVNEVSFTRPGGASGVIRDQTSINTHGRKTKSVELNVTDDQEVLDASYSTLNQYKDAITRCDQVVLRSSASPGLFPVALGVEIGDKIRIGDLPTAAPAASVDFYVEAVSTQVSSDGGTPEWVTTLSLSPAVASDVWILEDVELGLLDQTTDLAW